MTNKKLAALSAKKKASRRVTRLAAATPPFGAPPRLAHGFLVRLPPRSALRANGASAPVTDAASATTRAASPANARREGPCDDATFH
jgi:hypothetical protein